LRNNDDIVKNVDVACILSGSPEIFALYEDFLSNPKNAPLLENNNALECGTYLLLKNN
jgi:hypothetical protein